MAWFAWQSAFFILLAFVLGCLVGYWYWRIQYRRAAFTESEAVTVISRRHEKTLAEKDAEIGRLRSLLAGGAGSAVAAGSADSTDTTEAGDDPGQDAGAAVVSTEVVDVDGRGDDAAPPTDGSDGTGSTDGTDGDAAAAAETTVAPAADPTDAAPVTVVELPQQPDLPAQTVVDVTDDAVAVTDEDAVAQAVAQLPTQSTGEGDVIDLAALEGSADADADAPAATDRTPTTEPVGLGAATDGASSADGTPGPAAESTGDDSSDGSQDTTEDDLERIEGIGPRIAGALRTAGIRSFRRLADADVPTLQAALEAAGLRFAPSLPTWSRQARFLADGDEVGFVKLTESLVEGREPGRSR